MSIGLSLLCWVEMACWIFILSAVNNGYCNMMLFVLCYAPFCLCFLICSMSFLAYFFYFNIVGSMKFWIKNVKYY